VSNRVAPRPLPCRHQRLPRRSAGRWRTCSGPALRPRRWSRPGSVPASHVPPVRPRRKGLERPDRPTLPRRPSDPLAAPDALNGTPPTAAAIPTPPQPQTVPPPPVATAARPSRSHPTSHAIRSSVPGPVAFGHPRPRPRPFQPHAPDPSQLLACDLLTTAAHNCLHRCVGGGQQGASAQRPGGPGARAATSRSPGGGVAGGVGGATHRAEMCGRTKASRAPAVPGVTRSGLEPVSPSRERERQRPLAGRSPPRVSDRGGSSAQGDASAVW
jgi:hypothetical protein